MLLNYNHHLNNAHVCKKNVFLFSSSNYYLLNEIASSAGEILKASVNAPCTKEYCTFYKGADARIEFTFNLSKIIIQENLSEK